MMCYLTLPTWPPMRILFVSTHFCSLASFHRRPKPLAEASDLTSWSTPPAKRRGRLCDLLVVRGVTPAHKMNEWTRRIEVQWTSNEVNRWRMGRLTPSRLIRIFLRNRCTCWAHTKAKMSIAAMRRYCI